MLSRLNINKTSMFFHNIEWHSWLFVYRCGPLLGQDSDIEGGSDAAAGEEELMSAAAAEAPAVADQAADNAGQPEQQPQQLAAQGATGDNQQQQQPNASEHGAQRCTLVGPGKGPEVPNQAGGGAADTAEAGVGAESGGDAASRQRQLRPSPCAACAARSASSAGSKEVAASLGGGGSSAPASPPPKRKRGRPPGKKNAGASTAAK